MSMHFEYKKFNHQDSVVAICQVTGMGEEEKKNVN